MIVKGGVCTTGCDERELPACRSVHSSYYFRAAGNMVGGMKVVGKCTRASYLVRVCKFAFGAGYIYAGFVSLYSIIGSENVGILLRWIS